MMNNFKKLSDCITIISGGTPKTSVSEYWGGDIPWLSVKDFNNDFRYVYATEKKITELGLQNSSTNLLQKDDIIISARGTVGELAMIPYPMAFNQSCYGIRAKEGIDKTFLYYLIKNCLSKLKAVTHGTVFDTITRNTFDLIEVEIPELEIQHKIASILSSLDDKVELNNRVNGNLLEKAKLLFDEYFINYHHFNGAMPADWKQGVFDDIVHFQSGYAFNSSELEKNESKDSYKVFKQGHIARGGGFVFDGTKSWYPKCKCSKLERFILKKGDLLMAMTDMKGNVAILGNTAIMPVSDEYILNQRVGLIRPRKETGANYPYVYLLTNYSSFLYDLRSRANSGVQVNLTSNAIKESKIFIPPKEIFDEFNKIVEPLFERMLLNTVENEKIIEARNSLLPKLMSGQVDVSQIGD